MAVGSRADCLREPRTTVKPHQQFQTGRILASSHRRPQASPPSVKSAVSTMQALTPASPQTDMLAGVCGPGCRQSGGYAGIPRIVGEAGLIGKTASLKPCFIINSSTSRRIYERLRRRQPWLWNVDKNIVQGGKRAGIEGAGAGVMVANLSLRRIPVEGDPNNSPNYLTLIGEIAIIFGFVRRGSRAAKGIRL